ncbi:hypothetical protein AOQ84DRAFT_298369 [Glonium stellatum]|uniref:Uncharacterized protein n=1 Tax=Glonium stellatum TaxID=574774 RepID=A0A8E2EVK1_9PEZI|nr:hypothetical protein AOQ84DRAFT_298369 [Glonium stellatum]
MSKNGGILRTRFPLLIMLGTAVIFSAIHISAWNWEFPSPIVRPLWRIFALLAAASSSTFILTTLSITLFKEYIRKFHNIFKLLASCCFTQCASVTWLRSLISVPIVCVIIRIYSLTSRTHYINILLFFFNACKRL